MSGERVERRLAAILAADVAGYSRLMGQDEAGTLARLRTHRRELIDPKVAEHKGRIVKTTGDGILIEFPSVVEAVACAVAVQRGMHGRNTEMPEHQRIILRVGINLGDVIVEDGDIHGDGVNVAARLEGMAEPGGICVSRMVRDQVRDKLDLTFEDLGAQVLKNITRPVPVYRIRLTTTEATPKVANVDIAPSLALPNKPSIAVLSFDNMSNDPDQEFFADGMAEDIITALSRYPSLFVIARNSCFTYKGRAVDTKQVARELGVRYVLEGSLRKSANRIRVTAQLIEAETGNHIWAERYDRDLTEIFAVQDEITEAVTCAIAPAIAYAEQQRAIRKLPNNLDAWGAYQRGLWHISKLNSEDNSLAQKFFQQAIDSDPMFAGGYIGLALALNQAAVWFRAGDYTDLAAEEVLARRAVELDSGSAEAHSKLSITLGTRGDNQGALAEAKRALAICPNLAYAHGALGLALTFSGEPKQGVEALETCIRLDPLAPTLSSRLNQVALAYYFCREYEASIAAAERAIRASPDSEAPLRWLAAALGQLGRTVEAKEALDRAIAVAPTSFDTKVRSRPPWMRAEDHALMLDGLRKAGWPV